VYSERWAKEVFDAFCWDYGVRTIDVLKHGYEYYCRFWIPKAIVPWDESLSDRACAQIVHMLRLSKDSHACSAAWIALKQAVKSEEYEMDNLEIFIKLVGKMIYKTYPQKSPF
jgi:hypothetical protein